MRRIVAAAVLTLVVSAAAWGQPLPSWNDQAGQDPRVQQEFSVEKCPGNGSMSDPAVWDREMKRWRCRPTPAPTPTPIIREATEDVVCTPGSTYVETSTLIPAGVYALHVSATMLSAISPLTSWSLGTETSPQLWSDPLPGGAGSTNTLSNGVGRNAARYQAHVPTRITFGAPVTSCSARVTLFYSDFQ